MASLKNWGVDYIFALGWHGEGKHNMTILEAVKEAHNSLDLQAYYFLTDTQAANFHLSGKEDYILIEKIAPGVAPSQYLEIHADSGETGVMLNYFPQQVNLEMAKTLKPTQTTIEDMKALRNGGDEARKMIPAGYIGSPASFDIDKGKRVVEEKALNYANLIEKTVKGN